MAPGLTLTLALRPAQPKKEASVVEDKVFKYLYQDNPRALKHFAKTTTCLPLADILENDRFVAFVEDQEPGVNIDVRSVKRSLNAHGYYIRTSKENGMALQNFFEDYLTAHRSWLQATANYYVYKVNADIVKALYILKNDPELLSAFTKYLPDFADKAKIFNINGDDFSGLIASKVAGLHKEMTRFADALFEIKNTNTFAEKHRLFLQYSEESQKSILAERKRHEERLRIRRARRAEVRRRNFETYHLQMGVAERFPLTAGEQVAMVSLVLRDWHDFMKFDDETVFLENF